MGSRLIEAKGIGKSYRSGSIETPVLKDLDFSIETGSRIAIVGASGTGKSTLLHILGALDRPTAGTVLFEGENIYQKDDETLSSLRAESIGFVFQFHHLLPEFDATENVMMPLLVRGVDHFEARQRAETILIEVGLKERLRYRPTEMSGGEQQRIAVARAIVGNPKIVLADEPTGNLDRENGQKVFDLLIKLSEKHSTTLVIVTHNESLVSQLSQRFFLRDGRLQPLS